MYDVTDVELSEANLAVDRRRNRGIAELDSSAVYRGAVGIHRRPELVHLRLLLVHRLLLGNNLARYQHPIALEVLLGCSQLSLILLFLGDRLVQCRLQGARIDLR
jgi:hypothetical protein